MKITAVIHSLNGGGAERVMAGLANRLAARDHDVTLITLDDGCNDRHDLDGQIRRMNLDVMGESTGPVQRLARVAQRLSKLRRAILATTPNVVLSFCDQTNILTLAATRWTRVPVVVSERSDPSCQRMSPGWERARSILYPRARRLIALTRWSSRHLQPYSTREVAVIGSAIETPPRGSDRSVATTSLGIVGIGRLAREKGFDRLVEAFAIAFPAPSSLHLTILGEGDEREHLEKLIESKGLQSRVRMPGWMRPIWEPLGAATLFVLPSRYEGFPSALLEAMAMGVPSLAVDCESGPREIIDHASNGWLVENKTDAIARGMRLLMDDPQTREAIGAQGKSIVTRYGWDAMVDAYERVLSEAANSR